MQRLHATASLLTRLPVLALLLLVGSCGFLPQRAGDIQRATWVTRWDYKTETDIRNIMRNCAQLGIDTVFFQVRGQGTVQYASALEPWSQEFGHRYPGFDPLQVACDEGRTQGLSVHAWVNVLPGWRGKASPTITNQLYRTRPGWFLQDQNGQPQPLNDGYVTLNPCLPEVRDYLTALCEEITRNYNIAGVHLDYIRFPDLSEGGPDYPRDARTVSLYEKETGHRPAEDLEAWNNWKAAQVTRLVDEIHAKVRATKVRCLVTAAVYPLRKSQDVHQDWSSWVEQGKVAVVFPMLYHDSDLAFRGDLDALVEAHPSRRDRIFPAIGVYKHRSRAQTERQLQSVEALGFAGYGLYAYSSFFRSRNADGPVEASNPDLRVQRREAILSRPYRR